MTDDTDRTEFVPMKGTARVKEPALLVVTGETMGMTYRLRQARTTVGRDADCDLMLRGSGISRKHFELKRNDENQVTVRDLGSTNGIYVDGTRVETHVLRDGQMIQIGPDTVLKFEYLDSLEESLHLQQYEHGIHDAVTGLYNRRHFLAMLRQKLIAALHARKPLSIIKISIDHFGTINETYGFEAGEHLVRRIAKVLEANVPEGDLLVSWSEKKFAVLLEDRDLPGAARLAHVLTGAVHGDEFLWHGESVRATLSAGVAAVDDDDICEMQELLGDADHNLTLAKEAGGDRVEPP